MKSNPEESMSQRRREFGEHGGVNMSIEASTTFTVLHPETMPEIFGGHKGPEQGGCYLYGRHFNPTVYALGEQLAAMEQTEAAYCTASGMGAISSTVMQCCEAGDHILSSNAIYGGSYALLREFLPKKTGITSTLISMHSEDAIRKAIRPETKVIYAETFSNPTLRMVDIPMLARVAREHSARLVIDNTFAPLVVCPRELGADIVIHSMTKFISGGSDIIAGVVCADKAFIESLMNVADGALMLLGPTLDPKSAFDLSLRLPHLPIRMQEHGRRALHHARSLESWGLAVAYPGLESHTDRDVIESSCRADYGYGGVLSLDLHDEKLANAVMGTLQNKYDFGYIAVSLGYSETLLSCSGSSTSSEFSDEDKINAAISPGLLRISVGLTGTLEQRSQQLRSALQDHGILDSQL